MDKFLKHYFRCNSTLANDNTLYNVDCRYDENFSDHYSFRRTEDATMPCFKVIGKEAVDFAGVSQNFDKDRNLSMSLETKIRNLLFYFSANWLHNVNTMQWHS